MKRILFESLLLQGFSIAALCTLIVASFASSAQANCKVMESRNSYLGYSAKYGFSPSLSRVQNPYKTMLSSKRPATAARAGQLLDETLLRMGVDGGVGQAQRSEIEAAQEQLGAQLLSAYHQADYALIYGSERIKSDGSMLVAYQEIELNGAHSGERVEKILQIKRARALQLLSEVCRGDRCNPTEILNDPVKYQTALKTVIGIEITQSLKLCRS